MASTMALILGFPLLTMLAASAPEAGVGEMVAMVSDDECNTLEGNACSINALQHRGVAKRSLFEATPAPLCAAKWGACQTSRCCSDPKTKCFAKDDKYAQCRPDCTEGVHKDDLAGHQTPWSCILLLPAATKEAVLPVSSNATEDPVTTEAPTEVPEKANATAVKPPKALEEPPLPDWCVDQDPQCPGWADKGECSSSSAFMKENCQKSCKSCHTTTSTTTKTTTTKTTATSSTVTSTKKKKVTTTTAPTTSTEEACADVNTLCSAWSTQGECQKNPVYMNKMCKKSCKGCSAQPSTAAPSSAASCLDKVTNCAAWASSGECTKNPKYMAARCKKSCSLCDAGSLVEADVDVHPHVFPPSPAGVDGQPAFGRQP